MIWLVIVIVIISFYLGVIIRWEMAKVLVSGIMTVEDYKVNTYKDFYAFYLSIKKRGELLLSSFVISILIIPK